MQNIVKNWFKLFIPKFNEDLLEYLYEVHFDNCYAGPYRKLYKHNDIQNYIYQKVKFTCIMFTMHDDNKLMIILDSSKRGRICNHLQWDIFGKMHYPSDGDHSIPMVGLWLSINGLETSVCLKNSTFALKLDIGASYDIRINDHTINDIDPDSFEVFKDFATDSRIEPRIGNVLAAFVFCDRKVEMEYFDDRYVNYIETRGATEKIVLISITYWKTHPYIEPSNIKRAVDLLKRDGEMVITKTDPNFIPPMYSEEKKEPEYDDINMMEQLHEFISEFNKFVTKYGVEPSIQKTIEQNYKELMEFISKYN